MSRAWPEAARIDLNIVAVPPECGDRDFSGAF